MSGRASATTCPTCNLPTDDGTAANYCSDAAHVLLCLGSCGRNVVDEVSQFCPECFAAIADEADEVHETVEAFMPWQLEAIALMDEDRSEDPAS